MIVIACQAEQTKNQPQDLSTNGYGMMMMMMLAMRPLRPDDALMMGMLQWGWGLNDDARGWGLDDDDRGDGMIIVMV